MIFLDHIWLIPLLPALGAVIMFFFRRSWRSRREASVSRRRAGVRDGLRRGGAVQPGPRHMIISLTRKFIPGSH